MGRRTTYSDEQLEAAIEASHSWRGVLRALGLSATSASAIRSVRCRADRRAFDYSHFRGQRRWSDSALVEAVQCATSWAEVVEILGLVGGSSTTALRGHAVRLGLSTEHLARRPHPSPDDARLVPDLAHLRRSGAMIAAAWFALRGREVSWPLEPCAYDLMVVGQDSSERIQVKTTTRHHEGAWLARISRNAGSAVPYDPDEIDSFFVIDGDLTCFWIPVGVVGGLVEIRMAAYENYRVGSARSLA